MLALADSFTAGLVVSSLAIGDGVASTFWAAVFLPVWILLAKLHGLYDHDHRAMRHLTVDEVPSLVVWTMGATASTTVFLAISPVGAPGLADALKAWLVGAAAAPFARGTARFFWRRMTAAERTLIIGSGSLAAATRRKIELFPDMHVELVGMRAELFAEELRASPELLTDVDRVVLASHAIEENVVAELLHLGRRSQVKFSVVPPMRGMFGTAVQLKHIADLPVIEYNTWGVSRSTLLIKRVVDVALSSVALMISAPIALVIAAAIRASSPGPAIFAQRRAGLAGRPFRMYKFRTMVCGADELLADLVPFDRLSEPVFKLHNDPRVTRLGRFLRRTSLDELPQLLNVLKGDMSLVGPRPEQMELVDRYTPDERVRLAVKPGLTGPMQVYGRGELRFGERLALEREYIENLSLSRDLRILALTLPAVVRRNGAF